MRSWEELQPILMEWLSTFKKEDIRAWVEEFNTWCPEESFLVLKDDTEPVSEKDTDEIETHLVD